VTAGAGGAPDHAGHHAATRRGNLLGLTAILMWSSWAPLMVAAGAMPPFLLLAIAFSGASFVMLARRAVLRRGFADLLATPLPTLALGFAGLWGSNAMFVLALRAGAAPVAATIVTHTWPVWMALIVLALRIARGTVWDLFAFGLGFAGVVAIATRDGQFEFHVGLALALFGSFLWALYSGARTRVPPGPPDALTAFAIAAAAASWVCHLAFGEPFAAAPLDIALALAVGMLPMGIGNALWDIAVRRGDPVLLAGMSFIEPVCATGLILLMLAQAPRPMDMLGLALVLCGLALGAVSERVRRGRGAAPARLTVIKPPTGPAVREEPAPAAPLPGPPA
jgi:drug/metabolite transporter (DMT)-like permease